MAEFGAKLLADLEQRSAQNWLVGEDNGKFTQLVWQLFETLKQRDRPCQILLAEPNPLQFLASLLAACAAHCPVFLGNPHWALGEWQQVLELVQPDLIWGNLLESQFLNADLRQRSAAPIPTSPSPWVFIPTGGSSGRIRFAIHTWDTLLASVQGFQQHFQVATVNSCCVLPLYHVSGLMQFMRSFISGGQLWIPSGKSWLSEAAIAIHPQDFFLSLVPTQLQRLLTQPDTADGLAQFRTVLLGGAPAWPELLATARQYRIPLALTYGMTETASQIAALKPQDFLAGCMNSGQVLPHARVEIQDAVGKQLTANQVGQITIQAQSLSWGYYPDFQRPTSFQPDDLGFLDHQGYLHIVGRSSHKIITGGENVFPSEVEAVIRKTNLVQDVCVIGLEDQHWGQIVTAIYVPHHTDIQVVDLQAAIAPDLSKFKHPKHWIAVDIIPRNAQGKVNQAALYRLAQAKLQIRS